MASQLEALGGYSTPLRSTRGSQVHQADLSTESMTAGMWLPQPHQVDLPGGVRVGLGRGWEGERMG